jgi:Cof subfamily protein (haloacid dehalogenase superfamily)
VTAFAVDLDRTLIGSDATLGARTLRVISRSRAVGVPVLVATGRMFRSVRPYLNEAGIEEPVVCYQGALVADPADGEFLLHEPIPLELAREAVTELEEAGHSPNVYVEDELYVREHTEHSRRYADFQALDVTAVGDLAAWLELPPTKLVAVLDPERVPAVRARLEDRFHDRLFVTTSLPHFLELGHPDVSKGTGLTFVARLLGLEPVRIVAFGDGENDIDLLRTAGYGVAIEGSHPALLAEADATCPGPEREGVAAVIDAYLDSVA